MHAHAIYIVYIHIYENENNINCIYNIYIYTFSAASQKASVAVPACSLACSAPSKVLGVHAPGLSEQLCFCFWFMALLLFGMGLNKGKELVQICSGKLIPFAEDNLNSIPDTRYFGKTCSRDQTSIHSIQASKTYPCPPPLTATPF